MKQYIRLTKIKASENPEYRTPEWNDYKQGIVNEFVSIPADYWVEGYLIEPIEVGGYAVVDRRIRNGEEVSGFMTTSQIHTAAKNKYSRHQFDQLQKH